MPQRISLFLLSLLLSLTAAAQVVVEARLDSATIRVGEQVWLRTTVSCDKGARVLWPTFDQGMLQDSLEVVETSPIDTAWLNDGRRCVLSRAYCLTAFDSAVYRVPPFEVKIGGKAYTSREALALKVLSVAVDEAHPDQLKPPHAPVEAEFRWNWNILLLCLLLWGLALLLLPLNAALLRRRPLTRRLLVQPPPPPHLQAIAAIEQLRKACPTTADEQKAYYMQLTDVLRSYLHDRFGFNAREMTTAEILTALQQSENKQALAELREVLSTADLVKFARYETSLIESDRTLLQAADYVQRTKIPEDQLPKAQEQIVPLEQHTQQRLRKVWKAALFLDLLAILGLMAYICYLLWSNFA